MEGGRVGVEAQARAVAAEMEGRDEHCELFRMKGNRPSDTG